MRGRENEGSPLLQGTASPAQGWGIAGREGSAGLVPLGETSNKSRRRTHRRKKAVPLASFLRRNWRLTAGVSAVVVLSLALGGLAGVFSTIKKDRSTRDTSGLLMEEAGVGEAATAAPGRDTCEREGDSLHSIATTTPFGGEVFESCKHGVGLKSRMNRPIYALLGWFIKTLHEWTAQFPLRKVLHPSACKDVGRVRPVS